MKESDRRKLLALAAMSTVLWLTVMNVQQSVGDGVVGVVGVGHHPQAAAVAGLDDRALDMAHLFGNDSSSAASSSSSRAAAAAASAGRPEHGLEAADVAVVAAAAANEDGGSVAVAEAVQNDNDNAKPYAYAWVIGGIDAAKPAYKGFLYDVMISVSLLRRLGSTEADFWIICQLSHNATGTALPAEDAAHLQALGIRIHLLEKPTRSSFAHLVYEKFRPLQWTQYRRVMFLDADTVPLVNLDYLFGLSDERVVDSPTVLRPNLVVATRGEPCNTALFVMHPAPGAWQAMQDIVDRTHARGSTLPYPHFDFKTGWGHDFAAHGDYWMAQRKNGTSWRFHAGHSDQGLWYYYARYHARDASLVVGNRLVNVLPTPSSSSSSTNNNNQTEHLQILDGILNEPAHLPREAPVVEQHGCVRRPRSGVHVCHPVLRDFAHFSGNKKPWAKPPCAVCRGGDGLHGPHRLWYDELAKLNGRLGMGLDVTNFADVHMPHMAASPLGYLAKFSDHRHKVLDHADRGGDGDGNGSAAESPAVVESVREEAPPPQQLQQQEPPQSPQGAPLPPAVPKIWADNPYFAESARNPDATTVAYAVSFIKCGDWQTHAAGLTDASLVLRHSIHQQSRRNPASGSRYDYKMYAIVHRQAQECAAKLKKTGFEVVVVDPPVLQKDIQGAHLKKLIHKGKTRRKKNSTTKKARKKGEEIGDCRCCFSRMLLPSWNIFRMVLWRG